jgi:hypothetical protein
LITTVKAPILRFLGEQDGPLERDLKSQWQPILAAHPSIRRAFLALAHYADQDQQVVLALCAGGQPDLELVKALRVPFAAIFSSDVPLDMAFVNTTQESQLAEVCAPFYVAV